MRTDTQAEQSNLTAPTHFVEAGGGRYAYRRFGKPSARPLLFLQHFVGTLDNWDFAVTDALGERRDVILFDNAGIGRSSGQVPKTIEEMARHVMMFLGALGISSCDVLGFSLGGMIAQQVALDAPSLFEKMVLVGTAPRGGEEIMHLQKPSLAKHFSNPALQGYAVLQKIFFTETQSGQNAGGEFVRRLEQRRQDLDPPSGPEIAAAQLAAFATWEGSTTDRFSELRKIQQPVLVINGVADEMIPIRNSYWLAEHLPNGMLIVYPDAGHGSLFQYHELFTRQVEEFLSSPSWYDVVKP